MSGGPTFTNYTTGNTISATEQNGNLAAVSGQYGTAKLDKDDLLDKYYRFAITITERDLADAAVTELLRTINGFGQAFTVLAMTASVQSITLPLNLGLYKWSGGAWLQLGPTLTVTTAAGAGGGGGNIITVSPNATISAADEIKVATTNSHSAVTWLQVVLWCKHVVQAF